MFCQKLEIVDVNTAQRETRSPLTTQLLLSRSAESASTSNNVLPRSKHLSERCVYVCVRVLGWGWRIKGPLNFEISSI